MSDPLVSTDWLFQRLGDPQVMVLDATWFMPSAGRDARAEHRAARIPGSAYFDIDAVADTSAGLPHMLPAREVFAEAVSELGVGQGSTVVAYDANGLLASARLWWTFRAMGHDAVVVLDGGLARWRAEGRPLEGGAELARSSGCFEPAIRSALIVDFDAVRAAPEKVWDVRPEARFRGEAPEPRPGLRSGHMPGAHNLPYGALLEADGRLKPPEALAAVFADVGLDAQAPVVASCGSGVTACILALALARTGAWDAAVYDGSWAEWGGRADAPVITGG